MSSLESRAEVMKPLIVKAAALSIAAYICAKFMSKRSEPTFEQSSIQSEQHCHEDEHLERKDEDNTEDLQNEYINSLEHKLLELQSRYITYRALKEKELVLMELKSEMLHEKNRAEFLLKEIYLSEEENKRIGSLVLNFIKLLGNFQGLKKENVLLQRKARKLCKTAQHRLTIIRNQKVLIDGKNEELISNKKEIERRDLVIEEFENENKELKEGLDHLQREKIELMNQVDIEIPYACDTKVEDTESVSKKEYDYVLKELEQLEKDEQAQANEITYLKWSNACLRQELTKYHQQQEHKKEDIENRVADFEHQEHEDGNCIDINSNIITSKRRRFIKKIKKWVDGGQIDDKEKNQVRCSSKNNSVSEETQDLYVHARMSCSSV